MNISRTLIHFNWMLFCVLVSCSSSKKNKKLSTSYNNAAPELIQKFQLSSEKNGLILDSAIALLDTAIFYDSTNYIAYFNKLNATFLRQDYNSALNVISSMDKLYSKSPHINDYFKGVIYEGLNQMDSSKKYFQETLKFFGDLKNKFPDSVDFVFNHAMASIKLFNPEVGIKEMQEFVSNHPKNERAESILEAMVYQLKDSSSVPNGLIIKIR